MSSPPEGEPRLICLIGLPAVGKSTIGKSLAGRLGVPFYDTDKLVEECAGQSIAGIFEQEGESRFRELESHALLGLGNGSEGAVVATGGGIVTFGPSRQFLAGRAFAIYLRSALAPLARRLKQSNRRPLFRSGDIATTLANLHEQRDALYRSVARLTVDVTARARQEVVTDIARRLPPDLMGDRI